MVFLIPIIELGWSFGLMFVSCELAGQMSYEFDDIDYIIGQFNWYLFRLEVQKVLPIIIINAHEEVAFECYGSAMCNRETFKKVQLNDIIVYRKIELHISFHHFLYLGGE